MKPLPPSQASHDTLRPYISHAAAFCPTSEYPLRRRVSVEAVVSTQGRSRSTALQGL